MRNITLEELLEAGCHFGHQVTRQNPKSRDFVFEARDNIHIIDLEETKSGLERAAVYVSDLARKNGTLVLLGAKRQADNVVKDGVERANKEGADGIYFVTNRWIGGLFTNFTEVAKNFKRLSDLGKRLADPYEKARYTKKEISLWEKEKQKLESFYGGVATMPKIPDALYIIDTHLEDLAVREARSMSVTTVGITDTNTDPTKIDYPIPANDDAVGSIKLITDYIIDAWIEGRAKKAANDKLEAQKEAKKTDIKAQEIKKSGEKKSESDSPEAIVKKTVKNKPAKKSGEKKL